MKMRDYNFVLLGLVDVVVTVVGKPLLNIYSHFTL
jgi:hypothetical protein